MPKPFDAVLRLASTVLLWGMAGLFTLLCAIAIAIAAVIFAVTLGPFYLIGEVAEWIRNRGEKR